MVFYLLEKVLNRGGGAGAQLVAMMSDFIPEAVALGAALAVEEVAGALLAGMIALQNLPEGFNAQRELGERSPAHLRRPWLLALLVVVGPLATALGFYVLADRRQLLGALMLFAAGGILYLVFQDIAPDARLEAREAPALGARCWGSCSDWSGG